MYRQSPVYCVSSPVAYCKLLAMAAIFLCHEMMQSSQPDSRMLTSVSPPSIHDFRWPNKQDIVTTYARTVKQTPLFKWPFSNFSWIRFSFVTRKVSRDSRETVNPLLLLLLLLPTNPRIHQKLIKEQQDCTTELRKLQSCSYSGNSRAKLEPKPTMLK